MEELNNMLLKYPALSRCKANILEAFHLLKETYKNGGKVLVCGNGGSAADSEHIVGELMKSFMIKRKLPGAMRDKLAAVSPDGYFIGENLEGALPAISLVSQSSLISAFSNDVSSDMVFAQQVYGYAKPGDCLIGLSTSGNAKNVIYAAYTAKAMNMKTIAITGQSGGDLKEICDVTINVPSQSTPEIQEYHLPIYHTLCMMIEREFFTD